MDTQQMEDPHAELEKALMDEYLHEHGYSLKKLHELPKEMAAQLMKEATRYASLKMEEIQARARFVDEIHDGTSSRE